MSLVKKILFAVLIIVYSNSAKSQCTAPTFTLDFSSTTDTSYVLKNQTRGGVCCVGSSTVVSSSNCISFLVYINPGTELISFDVTNPSPSGSAYYQVNCGPPVSIGTPLCAIGLTSPFTITYCKPGGDSPNYLISAGTIVKGSADISIQKTGCVDTLFVSNVNTASILWTSIYPGANGDYNNYLSCTSGCNSTLVSPVGTPPPYVDFEVSGMPNTTCGGFSRDTIRVYFVPRLTGTITPASPVICSASGTTVSLTANISGGALPYKYDWSSDPGPNNAQSTIVSSAGTYTVVVTDNTKCPALKLTKTIASIPATTFTYSSSSFCKNVSNPSPVYIGYGQPGVFSASPGGLNFVNTNTGEIDLATTVPGTYVVTNTISPSGTCPGSSSTATVTIYGFPTMTSASGASICSGNVVNIPFSSSMSSSYTWYATDNINTIGESITTQTTTSLTNTITNSIGSNEIIIYTVTPTALVSGSCVGTPQTVSVTIRPKDDATFNYPSSTNCQTGTNPVATITGLAGGTFSAGAGLVFSDAVGTINLMASTVGSYTVTYTTNGSCPNSHTFPINITTAPSAAFGYTNSPYCQSAVNPLPTFSVNASGGTFSSSAGLVFTNNLTGEIDLSGSTPGTYTVTNTIAPSGLCGTSTATAIVTITLLKEAGFSYTASPICQTSSNPLPTFVTNGVAETFTSTVGLNINSTNGLINLIGSTPGTYTVTNSIVAFGGCPDVVATNTIMITELPIATFNYSATPFCSNSVNQLPTFTGGGVAGLFTPSSVYLNVNQTTGLIDISSSLPGDYIIANTIAASNGCPAVVVNTSITITDLPDASIVYAGPYCSNGANPTPTLNLNGANGIYTSTPGGLNMDANSGTIDLSLSTAGTYTVTNTVIAADGCPTVIGTSSVTITNLPIATFNYSATPYCISGSNPLPTFIGGGTAGTFTATSGLSINATSGLINLAGSTAGSHTVTNVIASANGCPDVVESNTLTINPIATASAASDATICASESYTLAGSIGGAASSLTWTTNGSGSFSNVSLANSIYTPSASDISAGSVTLTIRTNDPIGPCSFATDDMVLKINPTPTVSAGSTNTLTCSNTNLALSGSGGGTYAWSGPGIVSGSNSANPVINKPGTYSLVVTSPLGCPSGIATVAISQNTIAPFPTASNSTTLTCSTTTANLTGGPTTGVNYQWTGVGLLGTTTSQNATVNAAGIYTLQVTSIINGCIATSTVSVSSDTVIPTVLVSVPSVTTTCNTPTATLSITSTPSTNVSYSWTAPATGALDSYTVSSPVASGSGVYTVVVTNTISGCSSSITQNTIVVVEDFVVPTTTLSTASLSITCSVPTPSAGIATSIGTASYNWTPVSGIVAGTETSSTPSFSLPGTYSVVVTNTVSGCNNSLTADVVNVVLDNTIPVINITGAANDGTITCTNTSIVVTPTIIPSSNLTYTWISSTGAGISGAADQSTATFTAAGTYTLAITNTVTGCVTTQDASSIFTVYENTVAPTVLIASPSITTTCAQPTTTLNIAPTPSTGVVYSWTAPASGSLDSYTSSSPVASGSGIFTVVVTNTVSGCVSSSIAQSTIEVIPDVGIPTVTLSSTSTSITCSNTTPTVNLTASVGTVSYNWSPLSGIVPGTENTANPSFNAPGTYSVVVTNTVSGCATFINSNVVTVVLDNTIPAVNMSSTVNSETLTCLKTSVIITPTITPNSDLTYTWTSSTGTGIVGSSNQSSATFTAAGIYTLAVTNTVTGCSSISDAASTFTVNVDTIIPVSDFTFATSCSNDSVRFTDHSTTSSGIIVNWNWSFGDGNSSTLTNPANAYSSIDSYTVSLQVQGSNGCVNTSTAVVDLIPTVVANYSPGGGEYSINQPISFTNQSYGATGYTWIFSDGVTDNNADATHAFSALGSYPVVFVATNDVGCKDTVVYVFEIKPSGYAIPGGFTPNNDGLNDNFSVLGGPFSNYELRVFNEWGNEVFMSMSQDEKWDGTYKGSPQPAGTYIYIFNGKIVDGEELKLKGEVHIIR